MGTTQLDPTPTADQDDATTPSSPDRRAALFRASTWTMVLVLVLFSPAVFVVLGWFTEAYRDTAAASEVSHRLHEVVFGVFFSLALLGAASQLVTVRRNLAGLFQLVVTLVVLALLVTLTVGRDLGLLLYLVPLLGMVVFHGPIRPIREGPLHLPSLALVLIAAPAFVGEAAAHIEKAQHAAQNHTTHWSVIAAFGLVLLFLGLFVAFRVRGYRLVVWSLAAATTAYGLASLAFPYDASSHRPGYAIALLVWGGAWIVVSGRNRPTKTAARRRILRIVITVALVPELLGVAALVHPILDTPANVPHRPHPDQPELLAMDVERSTCLSCHLTGVGGAPQPTHPVSQRCFDEPCWGGRADCAGCHRIDPALGGPTGTLTASPAMPDLLAHMPTTRVMALSAEEVGLLQHIVGGQ